MNTKKSTDALLDLILTAVNDLVDFELAVILKLHEDKQLQVEKAKGPLFSNEISNYSIDLNQRTDIARIISINEPYLFKDDEEHTDTYDEILQLPDGHSCLVAPLYVKESPIGLMTFDHRVCGKFTPSIVRFIGTLSKLIAVIISQNDSSIYLDSIRQSLTRERNLLLKKSAPEFKNMIGNSASWEVVKDKVKMVAASDLPVLIQGETGTGKEQVARTIHMLSPRKDAPFITLNCSALNSSLAESELFGHEKGAFTSAVAQRRGRFEMADGGTLFLDEIADLPHDIQPKLLRTLQEGTFERVGGEKTLHCDVRIIAASNKDLRREVKHDRFREDLYYRLGVFPLFLPPLRERREDIALLAEFFLKAGRKDTDSSRAAFSNSALVSLTDYEWPGNVRELQNVILRSSLVAGGGLISDEHLGLSPKGSGTKGRVKLNAVDQEQFPTLDEIQKTHIRQALELSGGKLYGENGAAAMLGLKPTTLQSRMKKLGIS